MSKSANSKTRKMPSENKIRAYWCERIYERKDFDSPQEVLEKGICFACGIATQVYRAHIKARCDGGSDNVENLHMLCGICHRVSEFLSDDLYWDWFWERQRMDTAVFHAMSNGFNAWSRLFTTVDASKTFVNLITAERQHDLQLISERTRQALSHKKKQAQRVGEIPFGYDLSADGIHLEENAREQEVIAIIQGLRSEGLSVRKIAAELNRMGHRTKKGCSWSHTQVYRTLRAIGNN